MVAAINHLHRKISVDQIGKIMEQEASVLLKQMPGFEGIDLVKVTNDRGTVILYWDPAVDQTAEQGHSVRLGSRKTSRHIWQASNNVVMAKSSFIIESDRADGCAATI